MMAAPPGEAHGRAVLTDAKVRELRRTLSMPCKVDEAEVIEALIKAARMIHASLDGRFQVAILGDPEEEDAMPIVGLAGEDSSWIGVTISEDPELWHGGFD